MGDFLQVGLHYRVAGFDIYLGEVAFSIAVVLAVGAVCIAGKRLAARVVYLFTAEVEMKDSYAEKGFDGILLKPANLEALKSLMS